MQEIYLSGLCFNYNTVRVLGAGDGGGQSGKKEPQKSITARCISKSNICSLLGGGASKKKNIRGWQGASNGSFLPAVSCLHWATNPSVLMKTLLCLQKEAGWLRVCCRHFKGILLPRFCLCCSSAYFQFAVVLGKRFDSWFRMCTPRRFQEGFRQRDKACLFVLLYSLCSVAIIHTPHCA